MPTSDFYYQTTWRGFSPIFHQSSLPICWAAVAADSVVGLAKSEAKLKLKNHSDIPPLAVQEILDYVPFYNAHYVARKREEDGYFDQVPKAFEYIRDFGIHTAMAYPFKKRIEYHGATVEGHHLMLDKGSGAHYGGVKFERITIRGYETLLCSDYDVRSYVGVIAKHLRKQPLAAGIYVSEDFDSFKGNGIFEDDPTKSRFAHAVMLTGFGHECVTKQRSFWEIKYSSGLDFGDGTGYAKIPVELINVAWFPHGASIC
ncbi:hypothetical protein POM88_047545 [Heracleum sosnowskyi]|uniref:Peptidase C1A papain C-terminal domain-containing protein n=1 Tax=Heracleum sosnowskyi TaxID=360622 RepID=A0AAD8LZQ0_9APIA|nr:hypothetical protein POM88_047545 [Heracleum sosnowskyi]